MAIAKRGIGQINTESSSSGHPRHLHTEATIARRCDAA
jgi:hypothetical protein